MSGNDYDPSEGINLGAKAQNKYTMQNSPEKFTYKCHVVNTLKLITHRYS